MMSIRFAAVPGMRAAPGRRLVATRGAATGRVRPPAKPLAGGRTVVHARPVKITWG